MIQGTWHQLSAIKFLLQGFVLTEVKAARDFGHNNFRPTGLAARRWGLPKATDFVWQIGIG